MDLSIANACGKAAECMSGRGIVLSGHTGFTSGVYHATITHIFSMIFAATERIK